MSGSDYEPILIDCEGGETPAMHGLYAKPAEAFAIVTICPMCGEFVPVDDAFPPYILAHQRRDILAEIERGDFDLGAHSSDFKATEEGE